MSPRSDIRKSARTKQSLQHSPDQPAPSLVRLERSSDLPHDEPVVNPSHRSRAKARQQVLRHRDLARLPLHVSSSDRSRRVLDSRLLEQLVCIKLAVYAGGVAAPVVFQEDEPGAIDVVGDETLAPATSG